MVSSFSDRVASQVRAEMARTRMTQAALAARLEVSPMYVSRRVSGELSFTVAEVEQIARILEVPIATLLPTTAAMQKAG